MKPYKPRRKTLEKIMNWLDSRLQYPLSMDDALYMRWKIHNDLLRRDYENIKESLFREWCEKYQVRYNDGVYERGQILRKNSE